MSTNSTLVKVQTYLLPTKSISFSFSSFSLPLKSKALVFFSLALCKTMERPESENERRRRVSKPREMVQIQCPPRRMLAVPPPNQAKLAAIAVDLNVRLRSAEMPGAMQERAFRSTRAVLDANLEKKLNPTHIAMCIKKEFDSVYGPAWHCIVGKSFGSFVTHSSGGFVYFSVDKLCFLLFKTEVRPVRRLPALPPLAKLKINA